MAAKPATHGEAESDVTSLSQQSPSPRNLQIPLILRNARGELIELQYPSYISLLEDTKSQEKLTTWEERRQNFRLRLGTLPIPDPVWTVAETIYSINSWVFLGLLQKESGHMNPIIHMRLRRNGKKRRGELTANDELTA